MVARFRDKKEKFVGKVEKCQQSETSNRNQQSTSPVYSSFLKKELVYKRSPYLSVHATQVPYKIAFF